MARGHLFLWKDPRLLGLELKEQGPELLDAHACLDDLHSWVASKADGFDALHERGPGVGPCLYH